MRVIRVCVASTAALFLITAQSWAQNKNNPIEIALLRWYQANTANALPLENTCISPQGVAFDGAHMWVACFGSNEIGEYNTNAGSFVQKVPLSHSPNYLLYDGANVWVAYPNSGVVDKVQASTGTVLQPVTVGAGPWAMAFDGQYVWVSNRLSNSLSKVLATSGAVTTISLSSSCAQPTALAYDTAHSAIWVACNAAPLGPYAIELNSTTGALMGTTAAFPSSPFCLNMAYDGNNMWVADQNSSTVIEINTTSRVLTTISLPANSSPAAVAYDGLYIWVARQDGNVTKLLSGSVMGTWPSGGGEAYLVAFDGGNVWVTTPLPNTHGAYTISKM